MYSLLYEILGERYYTLQPSVFGAVRKNLFSFLLTGNSVHVESDQKLQAFAHFSGSKLTTSPAALTDFHEARKVEAGPRGDDGEIESSVKTINILNLNGPMTRNGDECSYGSQKMRDMLIEAADREDVIGHVIYCQTPGGMASTLIDFRKAIDYIHSKGQKIYMFCDGTVASGGTFLSAMCDGVYAYNGDDEIGSIGMYGAFFTLANGAVNSITQETYVEYYAEKSKEKNLIPRAAAEGDLEPLKKDVDSYLDELLVQLKQDRPSITEEQMTGAMFRMKDVVGTIIDGITTLPELCQKIYDDWATEQVDAVATPDTPTSQNNESMNKEYFSIAQGAGYAEGEKLISDSEGLLTLQPQEADALETTLKEMRERISTMTAELEVKHGEQTEREKELEAKIAELNALNTSLQQNVTDLSAELQVAKSGENDTIKAGETPDTNGASAVAPRMESNIPAYDSSLSPSENAKRLKDYLHEQATRS